MNYQLIYDQFIESRKNKSIDGLKEVHHIRPRCLGGLDYPENLVALSPRDHFFAHLLLAKIHGGKLWAAVILMSGKKNRIKSSRVYHLAKNEFSAWAKEHRSGENHPMFGKNQTEEAKRKIKEFNLGYKRPDWVKEKISQSVAGSMHPMYGKKHSAESVKKMSDKKRGVVQSRELVEKRAESQSHKEKYKFFNLEKNILIESTKREFYKKYDLKPSSVWMLLTGRQKKLKGWVLANG